jgi:hypothetical protein
LDLEAGHDTDEAGPSLSPPPDRADAQLDRVDGFYR